jgi:hypothetical protein
LTPPDFDAMSQGKEFTHLTDRMIVALSVVLVAAAVRECYPFEASSRPRKSSAGATFRTLLCRNEVEIRLGVPNLVRSS